MYEDGEGIEQSHKQALEWFRKAARQGHEIAIQTLNDFGESL
ncbi:SEL1-like repeat protein [Gimesia panareensis]|nr:SEL1-like repeat protein [Gimesia panareensis]